MDSNGFLKFYTFSFRRLFAIALFLLGFSLHFLSQNFFKNYTVYTADNGLPHNSVFNTFQDSFGFLWISTADGLVRYDGKTFVNYLPDPNNKKSIAGSHFCFLTQTNKNELWIVHNNGISVYDHTKDAFENILVNKTLYDTRNILIGIDSKNYLWALLLNVGLVKVDVIKKKVVKIIKVPSPSVNQKITSILSPSILLKNKILFCVPDTLFCYDQNNNSFSRIFFGSGGYAGSISKINDSSIVYLGYNQFQLQHGSTTQTINITPFLASNTKALSLIHYFSDNDSLAYISGSMGFAEFNTRLLFPTKIYKSLLINNTSTDLLTTHCFKDKFGNYWISTNGEGLIKVPYNKKQIFEYPKLENSNIVKAIKANDDLAFFGYYTNGLSVYDRKNKLLKHFSEKEYAIEKTVSQERSIVAIEIIDKENIMFCSSYQNGTYIYNIPTGKFLSLLAKTEKLTPNKEMPNTLGRILLKLRNGKLLFNKNFDLFLYDPHTAEVTYFSKIENENPCCCYEDNAGRLWIGTTDGLLFSEPRSSLFRKVKSPIESTVKCINQDKDNNFWVATVKGIYVLNTSGAMIKHYDTKNGLINSYVYSVIRDKNNDLWFSTNKGISKFNFITKEFSHFTTQDGLQGNEFNTNAYCLSDSGELFFGGSGGINSFYPQNMLSQSIEPTCRLAEINVGDKPFSADSSVWTKKRLILEPGNNTVSFALYGDDYRMPEKTQYKYYLEGFEKDWISNGTNNFIRYPNLPPGNYLLRYKCTNGDSQWQTKESILSISILPFWHQTQLARIAFIIGLVSIFMLGVWILFKRKEQKQKQKLSELQKIQDERTRISRDLHDNIGSMVSFVSTKIDWILKNKTIDLGAAEDLNLVKNNAKEIMTGLRETIWTLNSNAITNTELADKLKVYIKSHLLIEFRISDEIEQEYILENEVVLNVYRACQEIANNINKHSKASFVNVLFSNMNSKLTISFSDNGIGFSDAELQKQNCYGLRNIASRLAEVNVEVEIRSKKGEGTKIVLVLK